MPDISPERLFETASAPLQFAYWVPNVSGGLVVSRIEQRTDWGYDYNRRLAVTAENNGFDYALTQVRYIASYGAAFQQESTSFSLALLLATERLKVIAAVHPGLWQPGVLAKWLATADLISNGRAAVNVVSGWFKDEFTKLGEPWLEHDERYRRAEEFITYLRTIWTDDHAEFHGDFYRLHDFDLKPKPPALPGRPHPEIFQGGNSTAARAMAGRVSDWYFSNGKDFDGLTEQVVDVTTKAALHGRTVRFGLNGFLIGRDSEAEARDVLREIVDKADRQAVEGFRSAVRQAGSSTVDGKGMWQDSEFADLVQYNDGFRTGLVGTPERIAERIVAYKTRGVNLFLLGFLHCIDDVEYFGANILPLVRELEADLLSSGRLESEIARHGVLTSSS
ncbi:alkanesulfonate monooxygenase [Dietzia sp. UCD-THP]|uniref:dimethylsulfone monooxygenase SfnG n=1 Tax=Dietzia sp. UCD-THP TaxID=1292020 RepID=UPI0003786F9C|nr:dimethyl sulfone monooxygenase SfnG [Dietzia sp. UCD-THP]EYT57986.1 alkanesulfonate monooxygenase [Dietzia sp. UCD-THP]